MGGGDETYKSNLIFCLWKNFSVFQLSFHSQELKVSIEELNEKWIFLHHLYLFCGPFIIFSATEWWNIYLCIMAARCNRTYILWLADEQKFSVILLGKTGSQKKTSWKAKIRTHNLRNTVVGNTTVLILLLSSIRCSFMVSILGWKKNGWFHYS